MFAIESYTDGFHSALQDEIAAVRKGEGTRSELTDGRHLGQHLSSYLYCFTCDSELHLPDDIPVDVEYEGSKQEGHVESVDGFDIVLALPEYIGESPGYVTLYTAPWFLLEELDKRLQEHARCPDRHGLVLQMLSDRPAATGPIDGDRAMHLLRSLRPRPVPNREQIAAVACVVSNDVTYVWGPPGTGKTNTLALATGALVQAGETVLVCAHSNVAVDVAMIKVAALLERTLAYRDGRVLRYGVPHLPDVEQYSRLTTRSILRADRPSLVGSIERLEEERRALMVESHRDLTPDKRREIKDRLTALREEMSDLHAELKAEEEHLVQRATVVGCTLCKAAMSRIMQERRFSAVMVDEASMTYIPQCAFAAGLAKARVGIFGDFRQLAPIATAETPSASQWLRRDVFEESGIIKRVDAGRRDPRMVMLRMQYRMHPQISAIPNRLSYQNLLVDAPEVLEANRGIAAAPPAENCAVVQYDLADIETLCMRDDQTHSRFNLLSAIASFSMALVMSQRGKIGIATPYNAQSRLIHRLLQDAKVGAEAVQVSTVHRFQGSEREMILFDAVDAHPLGIGMPLKGEGSSSARRLLNVAVSRAKGKFVLLADLGFLSGRLGGAVALRAFLGEVSSVAPAKAFTWPDLDPPWPGLQWMTDPGAERAVVDDLHNAREEVAVYWPDQPAPIAGTLSHVASELVRCFISGRGQTRFRSGMPNTLYWWSSLRAHWGLIAIDRQVLWLWQYPGRLGARVLRLQAPTAVALLYAFLDLVPEKESTQETIGQRFEKGESVVGPPCPRCSGLLWPRSGPYGVYLACTTDACGYRKRMTPDDATAWARLNGVVCPECGGQMRGRSGSSGLFWGCSNYPRCRGTRSIESTV